MRGEDPFKVSQIHLSDQPTEWKRTNSIKLIILLSLPSLPPSRPIVSISVENAFKKLLNCHCNRWTPVRRTDDESSHSQMNSLSYCCRRRRRRRYIHQSGVDSFSEDYTDSQPPSICLANFWLNFHRLALFCSFLATERCSCHGTICSRLRPFISLALTQRLGSAMLAHFQSDSCPDAITQPWQWKQTIIMPSALFNNARARALSHNGHSAFIVYLFYSRRTHTDPGQPYAHVIHTLHFFFVSCILCFVTSVSREKCAAAAWVNQREHQTSISRIVCTHTRLLYVYARESLAITARL